MSNDESVESTVYRRNRDGFFEAVPAGESSPASLDESAIWNVPSEHVIHTPQPSSKQPVNTLSPNAEPNRPAPTQPKATNQKRRFLPRKVSRVLRIALVLYLVAFIWVGYDLAKNVQQVKAFPTTQIADTAGTNWLLVGTDSRKGLTPAEERALHTGSNVGQRADTIMLVHFGGGSKPTIISFPRDSWVIVPKHRSSDGTIRGEYRNKINATYSIGGERLLVETIERNTGLHVDHFMSVGFLGIRDLTNAVGGVRMCPKRDYKDKNSGLNVKRGCQVMSGKTALAYVRMRYADPEGDIGRIKRQQEFVASVLHKSLSPGILFNPFAIHALGRAAENVLTVGEGDGITDMARFALAMRSIAKGGVKTMTVPLETSHGWRAGQSVVIWNEGQAHRLFKTLGAQ